MANSSPLRRQSYHWASPQRLTLDDIFTEDRNSEARHRYLLETAKKENERVRQDAERVYREQLQKEERQRLLDERQQEEERIRLEEQLAADRVRLNALKAKKIAIPAPLPDPEPPAAPAVNGNTTPGTAASPAKDDAAPPAPEQTNGTTSQRPTTLPAGTSSGVLVPKQVQASAAAQNNGPEPAKAPTPALGGVGSLVSNGPQPNGINSGPGTSRSAPAPAAQTQTRPDRYLEIFKSLKDLRRFMADQAKANAALKARMGDMRREIRKSVGQLTVAAGSNRPQQAGIVALLREALENRVQSQLMDPSHFVLEPRNPVEGALHNDSVLPSLFLYLLNILSKAAISQFISEGGARPETADPVGICLAATFSDPDFLWRGQAMIDILMAKFRVVCPVLFGYRGSEKTEQGRMRLGWWKDGGHWVPEQQHMDRMTGLGAGFAAVALRKFAASSKKNPYPPRHYWTAMARIVNTPPAEISDTQCVVLKSMVQNYEQKFIEFYGTAAIAALRTALVEFPARAPNKTAAVHSVEVLAQLLRRDSGLVLG